MTVARSTEKNSHSEKSELIRKIRKWSSRPSSRSLNERAAVDYIISEGLINRICLTVKKNVRKRKWKILCMKLDFLQNIWRLPSRILRWSTSTDQYCPCTCHGTRICHCGWTNLSSWRFSTCTGLEPWKRFQRNLGLTYSLSPMTCQLLRFVSDRIAVICKGSCVEVVGTEELFNHPIHPFTQSPTCLVPIPDQF